MRPLDLIIDDGGEAWPAPFDGVRLATGCDANVNTFVDYSIRNLGFIRVQQKPHGFVVTLRPSATNPVTFASAIFLISDLPDQRLVLSCLEDSWTHVLCRDKAEARSRLLHAMDQAEDAREQPFLCERHCLDEVPPNSSISMLLAFWTECRGAFDDDQLSTALNRILRDRFALLSTRGDDETLLIENWGYGTASYWQSWLRRCRGLQFEDQPDHRYARAAAAAYREVLRSGQPLFDHVDAITSNAGQGKKRITYSRLIVPVDRTNGPPWLLSTSLLDITIDIRTVAGHEA
jgi:hypothetical protein